MGEVLPFYRLEPTTILLLWSLPVWRTDCNVGVPVRSEDLWEGSQMLNMNAKPVLLDSFQTQSESGNRLAANRYLHKNAISITVDCQYHQINVFMNTYACSIQTKTEILVLKLLHFTSKL